MRSLRTPPAWFWLALLVMLLLFFVVRANLYP